MDAEVIPDSDQLSSMYPVFVAALIIAVATQWEHLKGSIDRSLADLERRKTFSL
jgi:hypothetical protein